MTNKVPRAKHVLDSDFYVSASRNYNAEGRSATSFQLCIDGSLLAYALTRNDLLALRDSINMALEDVEPEPFYIHPETGEMCIDDEEEDGVIDVEIVNIVDQPDDE